MSPRHPPAKLPKLNVALNLRAPALGFVGPEIGTFLRSDVRMARVTPPTAPTPTASAAAAAPATAGQPTMPASAAVQPTPPATSSAAPAEGADEALRAAERAVAAAQDSLADAFVAADPAPVPGADELQPAAAAAPATAAQAAAEAVDEFAEYAFGDTNAVQFASPAGEATAAAGAASTTLPGTTTLLVAPASCAVSTPDFSDAAITAAEAVADFAADMAANLGEDDVAAAPRSDAEAQDVHDDDFAVSTSGALENATRALADYIAPRAQSLAVDIDALMQNRDALGDSAAVTEATLDELMAAMAPAAAATEAATAAAPEPCVEPPMAAVEPEPVVEPAATATVTEPFDEAAATVPEPEPLAEPAANAAEAEPFAEPVANAADTEPFAEPVANAAEAEPFAEPAANAVEPEPFAEPAANAAEPAPFAEPSPAAATAAGELELATAVRELQADVRATMAAWREGVPPALADALAPIREQLDQHGELLTQQAAGLRGLEAQLVRVAEAQAATAPAPIHRTAQEPAASDAHATPAPAAATPTPAATPAAPAAKPTAAAAATTLRAPLAVSCLGAAWSLVLWWKTGSLALALGMSVAAAAMSTLLVRNAAPTR